MEGGGTGGGDPPRGDFKQIFDGCSQINFETILMSTTPESLEGVAVKDVLTLALRLQQGRSVVTVLKGSQLVGTVGSSHLVQLIECMRNDHQYVADVLSLEGGACLVRVQHSDK